MKIHSLVILICSPVSSGLRGNRYVTPSGAGLQSDANPANAFYHLKADNYFYRSE